MALGWESIRAPENKSVWVCSRSQKPPDSAPNGQVTPLTPLSLNEVMLWLCGNGPQPFWHQGQVLQKIIFPWTRAVGWFQDDSSASHFSSVQFSCSVVSDSLRPHGLQHARLPCPSPTPGAYSNSCPWSWWCHPTVSSTALHILWTLFLLLWHQFHLRSPGIRSRRWGTPVLQDHHQGLTHPGVIQTEPAWRGESGKGGFGLTITGSWRRRKEWEYRTSVIGKTILYVLMCSSTLRYNTEKCLLYRWRNQSL